MAQQFIRNTVAPDGIHDNIEFNEYQTPEYWMKRREIRDFWNHVAPVGFCVGVFLAFVIMGYIEVCL